MIAPSEGARVQVELQDILAIVVGLRNGRGAFPRVLARSSAVVGAGVSQCGALSLAGPGDEWADHHAAAPAFPAAPASIDLGSESIVDSSRRQLSPSAGSGTRDLPPRDARTTWAERAWLLIGAYWIVLGIFVIPAAAARVQAR